MKKLYVLFGLFALMAVIFISCQEDDLEPPTISVSPTTDDAGPGEAVSFTVSVSSDQELISVKVTASTAGATGTSADTTFEKGKHTASYSYVYIVPSGLSEGSEITLDFLVTDKEDLTDTATAVITIIRIEGDIVSYTDITLGAQYASEGSSFATVDGEVYSRTEADAAQAKIDFIYYYGSTNQATLAAPSDESVNGGLGDDGFDWTELWNPQNATKFKSTSLTTAEFDAITMDGAIVTAATNASESKITKMAADKVYAFITASTSENAEKMGLIKVVSLVDGDNKTISIEVKIQE